MVEYKLGEFEKLGAYLLEVIEPAKETSLVKVLGVLRYPALGLGKGKNDLPKFIDSKPLKFETVKRVPNKYLHDTTKEEFHQKFEIGSQEFYNYTLHASLFIAQQAILKQIQDREVYKQPADFNLCKVFDTLTKHAKDYGFKLMESI